jgi:hypothetical protein
MYSLPQSGLSKDDRSVGIDFPLVSLNGMFLPRFVKICLDNLD